MGLAAIIAAMAPGAVLRQTQKNKVLEVLVEIGLSPAEFSWEERTYTSGSYRGPADVLRYMDSQYHFEFMLRDGSKHYARMSPGSESMEDSAFPGGWAQQLNYVQRWASDLRTEIDAPDLWKSAEAWSSLSRLPPTFEDNRRFTSVEIAELNGRLDAIGARLADLAGDDQHRTMAASLIEHLRLALPKQGRRDWIFLALGSIVSLAVNVAFEPERAKEIVDLLVHGFRSLGAG